MIYEKSQGNAKDLIILLGSNRIIQMNLLLHAIQEAAYDWIL